MEADKAKTSHNNFDQLLNESRELTGGMGAVAWAALEMFKQAGMPAAQREALYAQMTEYFAKPSDEVCNSVLRVLEARLQEDKGNEGIWYS
jgi:hypothetical protein